MKKKHNDVPDEAPIYTAQGKRITVKRDSEGRLCTYRKIDPDKHVMGDNTVNYCADAVDEATARGIEYHQIEIKGEGFKHVSHDKLVEEGRQPRCGTYPQKGLPLDQWSDGKEPSRESANGDASEGDRR